jgi:DNA-binding transcriptional LysR family regulator
MSDIVEFRHLEYLVAIAKRTNFSKAAEHVLRSQPAVSHQIKMVEADLGYPLLVRDGRNVVYPTPAGEFVLMWARIVPAAKKETFRMARAIRHEDVICDAMASPSCEAESRQPQLCRVINRAEGPYSSLQTHRQVWTH